MPSHNVCVRAIVGTRSESEQFCLGQGPEEEEGRELIHREQILAENKINLGNIAEIKRPRIQTWGCSLVILLLQAWQMDLEFKAGLG